MERIYPVLKDIEKSLNDIRLKNHIERYQIIKRYCYGNVLDIACGVGYGSYLLSNNPDITSIVGVDCDQKSIDHAEKEFANPKTHFVQGNIECYSRDGIDTLVSIETIEHLPSLYEYQRMVERISPNIVILSFPNKKSTHFNSYHKQDLNAQTVTNWFFGKYVPVKELYQHDISIMIFIKSPDNMPNHLFDTRL